MTCSNRNTEIKLKSSQDGELETIFYVCNKVIEAVVADSVLTAVQVIVIMIVNL
jgi:hypothetical protein